MIPEHQLLSILCYVQRGMLDFVTPNLRALYVIIINEATFKLVLYYDKPLTEDEEELASLIDTYVAADLSLTFDSSYEVKVVPYPIRIPEDGYCAYKRYEKD